MFEGVRFALFGFDALSEHQVRSKLVEGGGVDAGGYTSDCTHVIVDKLLYDDPVCVAARDDGKVLVTALWVDHSYDLGTMVDPSEIMYRPLKDLNGIPGAKNLVMCLTGYQRQDREDIMTMVGLMGAQFSKPLVANKVTHLICYKFEGEKYELAKKMRRIKLVNHRWLEDCLREWEILPEANYSKSTYELEMMEVEAKDSEDEAEESTLKQPGGQVATRSPLNTKAGSPSIDKADMLPDMVASKGKPNIFTTSLGRERESDQTSNNIIVPEKSIYQNAGASGGVTSIDLPLLYERTPFSRKVGNSSASTSRNIQKSPESETNIGGMSDLRKMAKTSLSMYSVGRLNDGSMSPKVDADKLNVDETLHTYGETENAVGTNSVFTPQGGEISPLYRTGDLPFEIHKSQKTNDVKLIAGSAGVSNTNQRSAAASTDGLDEAKNDLLGKNNLDMDYTADLHGTSSRATKPLSSNRKQMSSDLPFAPSVTLDVAKVASPEENIHPMLPDMVGKSTLNKKAESGNNVTTGCGTVEPINQQQTGEFFNCARSSEKEKSHSHAEPDLPKGETKSAGNPLKRKVAGQKTLGSRAKLSSTANRKGSIYMSKMAPKTDASVCENEENRSQHDDSSSIERGRSSPVNDIVKQVETTDLIKFTSPAKNNEESRDDETEAPDKDEHELENVTDNGNLPDYDKSRTVESTNNANMNSIQNLEDGQSMKNKPEASVHATAISERGKDGCETEMVVCMDNAELGEPELKQETGKGKLKGKVGKGKKPASNNASKKTIPAVVNEKKSEKDIDGNNADNEHDSEDMEIDEEKREPCAQGKTKRTSKSVKKSKKSMDVEKENKPVNEGDTSRDDKNAKKIAENISKENLRSVTKKQLPRQQKIEPAWFIVSGHRLQRKEFQQLIKRLKGKVCRDSHQWSYQATHFIAPDPIRRTEKFFAAATSGRWILKTDYLAACCQAGKFLAEEPYEWHKNCLTEDGAINLEAPRKWRLLREKTGHGAFFGMKIIVYGECIAPPLDTLKRVVKAGDGTILATSPPYTRFLDSGVDYAIVSPGMPRVDMWVWEFLKHEIPCVTADYLVEYICKPGYPLEKHVLYNAHAWAAKSFANLQGKAEEIIEDISSPESSGGSDLICEVCGSSDREDVMLICGDESGTLGCGIGTHIDCCDPPLEKVPEEDWFCPKCIASTKTPKSSNKRRKKGSS